ncbi:MAG: DUF2442 domain-containing protein [Nitrospirales bacterium]
MSISAIEITVPAAETVAVTADTLTVKLSDGRSLSVPLAWFPRLVHATAAERRSWRLIGRGHGIHWSKLDEDISVEGLLDGRHSGEVRLRSRNGFRIARKLQRDVPPDASEPGTASPFPQLVILSLHFSARSSNGRIVLPNARNLYARMPRPDRCR